MQDTKEILKRYTISKIDSTNIEYIGITDTSEYNVFVQYHSSSTYFYHLVPTPVVDKLKLAMKSGDIDIKSLSKGLNFNKLNYKLIK